jgi:hypothetical protein
MTYREKRERKAERLRSWADGRDAKADAAHDRVDAIVERIPFGQPILVGHHSERGARADQRRIEAGMNAACENAAKAAEMRSRADNIEAQARTSIYSDDPDALEALRLKLEGLEAKREIIKTRNAAFRKEHAAKLKGLTAYERDLAMPHRGYELRNLAGVITNTRKRIAELEAPERARLIIARYDGTCRDCGAELEAGQRIRYYKRSREAACETCESPATEPAQLTVDGREEPACAPVDAAAHEQPHLFTAPQTIRGQLAL